MSSASDRLRDYPAPEESVVAVYTATLSGSSHWKAASIGLTDRRLLCVADDGEFMTLGYDSICAIQSQPRTTHTYRVRDYRPLLRSGGLVAVLALVGIVAVTASLLVPLLLLVAVGGLVTTAYLRRSTDTTAWDSVTEIIQRAYDFDAIEIVRHHETEVSISTDDGRTVHLRSGTASDLDRDLSRLSFTDGGEPAHPRPASS